MTTFGKFVIRAAIAVGFVGVFGSSYASDISYLMDIPVQGDLTVAGTITTDGTIGPLAPADVVSYNFSETSTSIPYTAQFNQLDSLLAIYGLGANASGIYINSAANGGGYFVTEVNGGPGQYSTVNPLVLPGDGIGHYGTCTVSCLENDVEFTSAAGTVSDFGNGVGGGGPSGEEGWLVNPYSGIGPTYIATRSVVPEPSTWAMMLLGFAGLGFAGYRRTIRKSAATPLAA